MSVSAYGKTQNKNLSDQEIPARALLDAAKRLSEALNDFENRDKMDKAIDFHSQVWTIFQNEAASETTSFRQEAKIMILKICLYTDRAILDFFGDRTKFISHIETFIQINRDVAQGFLQNREKAPKAQEQNIPSAFALG